MATRENSKPAVRSRITNGFSIFARSTSSILGSAWVFAAALLIIVIWAITGPVFYFSDTWQLIINTGTTIVTFLMVFLIQNTQNRDNAAAQLKLDELIRSTKGAHNALLDLEELTQTELEQFRAIYEKLAERARRDIQSGLKDTGTPDVVPR